MRRPGRPRLDSSSTMPSAAVHLKLSAADYDAAYAIAKREGITVPELIRNAIEIEIMIANGSHLVPREAFRLIRERRNYERQALLQEQATNRAAGQMLRQQRIRAGFVERVRRSVVFNRHRGVCGICGHPVDPLRFHVDHIIPLSRGGQHSYANTQPAHKSCNQKKHARVGFALPTCP